MQIEGGIKYKCQNSDSFKLLMCFFESAITIVLFGFR